MIPVVEITQIDRLRERNDRAWHRSETSDEQLYVQNQILLELVTEVKALREALTNGVSVVGEQE